MDLETTPALAGVPDPAWLLLFTSWIILLHGSGID
jgi:hypothetical protein